MYLKKLKKDIIECVKFYRENVESITSVAKKFNIDKATLKKHKDINIDKLVFYKEFYYEFSSKELDAVNEYVSSKVSASYIRDKYGFKHETLNKMLEVLGFSTTRKFKVDFNRNVFSTISTEADAYFLGLLLADGYINNSKGMVRLKLKGSDVDILEKFCDYLGMSYDSIKSEIHSETGNTQRYVGIHSKDIVSRLESYNIFQAKSCREKPYYNIKKELLSHYLRGYFDGDGCIYSSMNSISVCGSKEILKFFCDVFKDELGIIKEESSFINYDNMFKIIFSGNNMMKILDYLYADSNIYLKRKYNLFNKVREKRIAMSKSGNIGKS